MAITPVIETIAQLLLTRLETLTTASADNLLVSEVIRPRRLGGFTPKHMQIVVTQAEWEIDEDLSRPGNPPATAYRQRFNIRCHVMPSEKLTGLSGELDRIINSFAASVVRAVTNASDWHNWGGNAINSFFEAHENIDGSGSTDGVSIPLIVIYRTDENDPSVMRA